MKLDQFNDFCQRMWGNSGVFSDVVALHLTDESQAELSANAINGSAFDYQLDSPFGGEPKTTTAGLRVDKLVNPVTRSVVKVTGGADEDTATVQAGIDFSTGEPVTRIVALAAA